MVQRQMSTDVVLGLAQLAETATGEFTVDELLSELSALAASALQVDGAGVMIAEDGGHLRFVHADPASVIDLENLQQVLQRGPCNTAMTDRAAVVVGDITESDQWPEFEEAARLAGLRGVVAMPLLARGEAWGALDVYRSVRSAWTTEEVSLIRLFAGVAASYLVMAADRDQARLANDQLAHRATHDELTGLPGRALLFTLLAHALATARRHRSTVAVLFVDLDRFKAINDTLGHSAGDTALVATTERLRSSLRENDFLARLAGDEFVIVCEDLPVDPTAAAQEMRDLGQRLLARLGEPVTINGTQLQLSASIGVALSTGSTGSVDADAEDMLGEADAAMYRAKERDHGNPVIGPQTQPVLGGRRALEHDLESALEQGQLRVHYQPIVAPDPSHLVVAVEALLRWEHPEHGLLPAAAFIDLARHNGSITAIGHWVIDQACAQLASWRTQHAPAPQAAPQTMFVNLSPGEIADPALDDVLSAALARHDIPPHDLGLEIVENDFADALLLSRLTDHHGQGHPLAVDDFGTGYSSLARLVDFPVQYAKIDRAFVAGLTGNPRRQVLIETIVSVAHDLGLTVIAEGVETAEQVLDLTQAGCDLLQGYHLAPPQSGQALSGTWGHGVD